jgi:hypothetical protein
MDKFLYNAINKYFKTLRIVGSIDKQEEYSLFVITGVYSIYKLFNNLVTKADKEKLDAYIRCLAKNKCLFDKNVPCLSIDGQINSLITIIDSDIIETTQGNVMVATNGKTQRFTDFEVRTELQGDNYVVGYDQSENNEVAINVQDLGVFWEVDV